jgi:hypothetical protein
MVHEPATDLCNATLDAQVRRGAPPQLGFRADNWPNFPGVEVAPDIGAIWRNLGRGSWASPSSHAQPAARCRARTGLTSPNFRDRGV